MSDYWRCSNLENKSLTTTRKNKISFISSVILCHLKHVSSVASCDCWYVYTCDFYIKKWWSVNKNTWRARESLTSNNLHRQISNKWRFKTVTSTNISKRRNVSICFRVDKVIGSCIKKSIQFPATWSIQRSKRLTIFLCYRATTVRLSVNWDDPRN